jgi:hypothetical protein
LRRLVGALSQSGDRQRSRPSRAEPDAKPAPITPAEYWTYLCAAALLVLVAAVLRGPKVGGTLRESPASGAFGTSRSSDEPKSVQHARAHEPRRGRHADTPWQIPWRGWKDILWRTYQQIAQLNSEIEHQTARDSTVEHDKTLGTRGACDGRYGRRRRLSTWGAAPL